MYSYRRFSTQTNQMPLHPRVLPALLILWEHRQLADAAGDDPWDHAVAEAVVRASGINAHELQTLIEAQLVDYATRADASPASGELQDCCLAGSMQLFTLTDRGAAMIERILDVLEMD